MNFNLEISNRTSEVKELEMKLLRVEVEKENLLMNHKRRGLEDKEYKNLLRLIKEQKTFELKISSINRYLMDLKFMRKQETVKRNIERTNTEDRMFRHKARELLSDEMFTQIYEAMENEIDKAN